MARFRVEETGGDGYGRLGTLDVPNGPVSTPAMFPVINMIGGTTEKSGGVWRRMRDDLISTDHLQGVMFQAMSFTDYGVTPENLKSVWRSETFQERFPELDAPVFIDSGGFKLMNSTTFGQAPQEGGAENEWGLYTNPKSILGLQIDFGADIIATLDYPIPPDLQEDEKTDRMRRSIESAVECLQLIHEPSSLAEGFQENEDAAERLAERVRSGDEPGVYVALHGHDYETVNWYVGNFLDRIQGTAIESTFEGFAVGSLVPLRSSVDILVDIVQGAKDALPEKRADEIGLHVFGVGGKQVSLLALLGVDSFDSTTHMRTAQYQKYTHPETWRHHDIEGLESELEDDGGFPCHLDGCTLCGPDGVDYETLVEELNREWTYEERQEEKEANGRIKSDYYALLARHNFEVYNEELRRVREKIRDGSLLSHVIQFARDHESIKRGLKEAQRRDRQLRNDIASRGAYDLLPGPEITSDQTKLAEWGGGIDESSQTRSISLQYSPAGFDISAREYHPPTDRSVLLLIPCSQQKPYSDSRTHSVLFDKIGELSQDIHKVTISGMYGPVPEEFEQEEEVLRYSYVLANEDEQQISLVTDRIRQYLADYGDEYDNIVGYVTSKTYREAIENAIEDYGRGAVFPRNPQALQLTEYFKESNIQEFVAYLDSIID